MSEVTKEKDQDFKELIRNLIKKTEEYVVRLKECEDKGTDAYANGALWAVYSVWTGDTYKAIEDKLRSKGHKSVLDEILERNRKKEIIKMADGVIIKK